MRSITLLQMVFIGFVFALVTTGIRWVIGRPLSLEEAAWFILGYPLNGALMWGLLKWQASTVKKN